MNTPVQILYLEDNPRDAELVRDELSRTSLGYDLRIASNRAEYEAAVAETRFDLILSDYRLPDYDGLSALALVRVNQPEVPFILLSGTLGEEEAVDCVLRGATDYLLKHRRERLVPAVQRALAEAENRQKHREAEEALRVSEVRYRRLFEAAKDGILILDAETGMVMDVNPFLIDLLGYSRETFLGRKVWELGFLTDVIANEANFVELQQQKQIRYKDKRLKTADGHNVDVEFAGNVFLVNRQRVIQCNIRDITERKHTVAYQEMGREILHILNQPGEWRDSIQRVLAAMKTRTGFDAVAIRLQEGEDFPYFAQQGFSNDFLLTENSLTERAADGGVYRDNDGKVRLECTCGLVISGKTDPTHPLFTPGGSCWTNDLFPLLDLPPDADPRFHPRNQCIHQGYASLALIPIRDKDKIVGLLQFNDRRKGCFSLATVECLEGIASHIGAALIRKQAEAALLESEGQYRQLFEANSDGIAMVDTETTAFTRVNAALCRMLGYTAGELSRLHVADIHPQEDWPAIMAGFEAASRGALHGSMAMRCRCKDGQIIHAEVNANAVLLANRRYNLAIFRDITERKQAEAEHDKLEAQLRQAQKMEAVGRLAGGVAHDFNNMLQTILGTTELLLNDAAPDDPRIADLKEIASAARRSADLTRQLLAFASKQIIAPIVLNLDDAVTDMLKMLHRLIGEDVDLLWKPSLNLWPVKMDPAQIDQILVNLVVNARDAIAGIGKVTIETGKAEFDEAYCQTHPDVTPGTYVMLAVSDTGCGMDPETQAHIFEPFFTTKEQGKGTGLGLATVYGIVEQNGGVISVCSEPGKGTTFNVYLPLHAATADEIKNVLKPVVVPTGTETVLLVEDEVPLLRLARRLLELLGYTVLAAAGPSEAMRLAAEYTGDIHLLLTDVVMPGLSGRDLRDRLSVTRPAMKCLFMSGYTADAMTRSGVLDQELHFVQKPFTKATLAVKLREALAGKA